MNKRLMNTIALVMSMAMLSACGNSAELSAEEQENAKLTAELQQNDYRGGVIRTGVLQDNVLKIMENMKQNNTVIREDSPNSFWNKEGYQDFVVNFLSSDIITDTQWFNEEETDWTTTIENFKTYENSFVTMSDGAYVFKDGVKITRNEKDDYSATSSGDISYDNQNYSGVFNYRILYDCDKDWCKAYATTTLNTNIPEITAQLYEYARIDENTFAIQTSTERLVVVFEEASTDTDLRERTIKEFYYSKLTQDGERTTFEPYEAIDVVDEETNTYQEGKEYLNEAMSAYPFINQEGDMANCYGKNNSIFLTDDIVANVDGKWVFEDKSLQQAIVYKDGALVVTTYNKLSENYERFIYTLEGSSDKAVSEIEDMVQIQNLVGTHKNDSENDESAETTDSGSDDSTDSVSNDSATNSDTSSDFVNYTSSGYETDDSLEYFTEENVYNDYDPDPDDSITTPETVSAAETTAESNGSAEENKDNTESAEE